MQQHNGRVVGIDLGTTNSAIAYVNDAGQPEAIRNPDGETMTPSVVFFKDDSVVVGRAAKWLALDEPARVVSEIKREMGNRAFTFPYNGNALDPETISGLILKHLKQYAEAQIGPISGAVIAVPFYFDDTRRKATMDAGQIAGLNVIDIVNEPVACALCYAYGRGQIGRHGQYAGAPGEDSPRPVLVYDLGGGTFDVAYVVYNSKRFQVVATDGDVRLGGTDWTRRLVDFAAERYAQQFGVDLRQDLLSHLRVLRRCEDAKHALSDGDQTVLKIAGDAGEIEISVSRDEFEEMTADLLLRSETTTRDLLEDAQVSFDDLADFILVGGATRMPMVRKMLERTSGWLNDMSLPASEPVALGAAIHAEIVSARQRGSDSAGAGLFDAIEEVNVNAHSLGIALWDRTKGGHRAEVMIRRNTPLPHSAKRTFRTSVPNQRGVLVQVLEGESPDPDGCIRIGKCLLDQLPPDLPARSPIEVIYSYEPSGRVRVQARDPVGGRFAETEIFRSAGLTVPAVEESQEFVVSLEVS